MSTAEDKFKHSKRLLKDDNAIKKQVKIAKAHGIPVTEPHRLAKHHALDCGNPKCLVCHSEKVFNKPTIQEKRFTQDVEHRPNKHGKGIYPNDTSENG